MFKLMYKSKASEHLSLEAYNQIIGKSLDFNTTHNLTGFLLFHKGYFIQLIEGSEEKVRNLYGKICKDKRHVDCELIITEKTSHRVFTNWNLFFENHYTSVKGIQKNIIRKQFDEFYHNSMLVHSACKTKYAVWIEVNKLLNLEAPTFEIA